MFVHSISINTLRVMCKTVLCPAKRSFIAHAKRFFEKQFLSASLPLSCGFALCLSLLQPAFSQEFERIKPKNITDDDLIYMESGESGGRASSQSSLSGTENFDPTPLVDNLKGLRLLPGIEYIDPSGEVIQAGVSAPQIPLLRGSDLLRQLEFYLDQPISFQSIHYISQSIISYYRDNDRPVVDVVTPEQDITNGFVQLVVIEGRVGDIKVEGNRWFRTDHILKKVRLQPGDPISKRSLAQDVEWINKNPFRNVRTAFSSGIAETTTDITLTVRDRFPLRAYVGYEDTGSEVIGRDTFLFGFNWGDAFGLDHQFNYQLAANSDFSSSISHAISYYIPLPWRHSLLIFGTYSDLDADLVDPLKLEGTSWQLGFRYTIPLPAIQDYKHDLQLGFDFKRTDNDLAFGGTSVFSTETDIAQYVLAYTGSLPDRHGISQLTTSFYYSPGTQDSESYQASRYQADPNYWYSRTNLSRITRLPGEFSLRTNVTYQYSPENLLGSEQLGLGGQFTVRGYEHREVNGDSGWNANIELLSPTFSPLQHLTDGAFQDQLQLLAFWDYGLAENQDLLPGEPDSIELSSVGFGTRYIVNPYLKFRMDFGVPLKDVPGHNDKERFHFGLILSY